MNSAWWCYIVYQQNSSLFNDLCFTWAMRGPFHKPRKWKVNDSTLKCFSFSVSLGKQNACHLWYTNKDLTPLWRTWFQSLRPRRIWNTRCCFDLVAEIVSPFSQNRGCFPLEKKKMCPPISFGPLPLTPRSVKEHWALWLLLFYSIIFMTFEYDCMFSS